MYMLEMCFILYMYVCKNLEWKTKTRKLTITIFCFQKLEEVPDKIGLPFIEGDVHKLTRQHQAVSVKMQISSKLHISTVTFINK